ncbi:hypothetical protein [Aquimarina megaterium]|uniref:hypothetical protein n=1 Tax=Aquimarina megaterium TaxID=1443666 RepID=UPI0004B07D91|nr:hypothetical protein [Aquimarina megaterium]
MANEKDLDYGAIGAVIVVSAIAFTALGTFYLGPKWVEKKQKKLAAAKKSQIASKKA